MCGVAVSRAYIGRECAVDGFVNCKEDMLSCVCVDVSTFSRHLSQLLVKRSRCLFQHEELAQPMRVDSLHVGFAGEYIDSILDLQQIDDVHDRCARTKQP